MTKRTDNYLMIVAGGTGGHVFPALAVAKYLQEQHGTRVSWLGTRAGLEAKVVPNHQIQIDWVTVDGLRGKGLIAWLKFPFKLALAVWQSIRIIRRQGPNCILGMGGFVAGPAGIAAVLLRCPLVIHEQNAVAGLTNHYLAKVAQSVLSGFPDVKGLPMRALWIGNPVRANFNQLQSQFTRDQAINILVLGGSQGAQSLNLKLAAHFAQLTVDCHIWHQCGADKETQTKQAYEAVNQSVKVEDFIDDMADAYHWADLVVCRAGAMTVAELSACGRASVLVPFPHSAGDHQNANAQSMVEIGGAERVRDELLGTPEFQILLESLCTNRARLTEMGAAAGQRFKPNAAADVARVCLEYLHA